MRLRLVGKTGLRGSVLGFGAGPVSGLMTASPEETTRQQQLLAVGAALRLGLNWFDTAASYGEGASERALGWALRELGATGQVHVATKVRLLPGDLANAAAVVRCSVEGSLQRLQIDRISLLQLHNAVTCQREALPTSVTPGDVLCAGGIAQAFLALQQEGLVGQLGLTGLGEAEALRTVLDSGVFATAQVPYSLLDLLQPRPGALQPEEYAEAGVAVIAIRLLAGGALAGAAPSPHTLQTPFFPLVQYEADLRRARELRGKLRGGVTLEELAVRAVAHDPAVALSLIGFREAGQVEQACAFVERGAVDLESLR